MYKFRAIKTEGIYINNAGDIVNNLTDHQKLISAIYTNDYTFVEIFTFTPVVKVKRIKDLTAVPTGYDYWQKIQ